MNFLGNLLLRKLRDAIISDMANRRERRLLASRVKHRQTGLDDSLLKDRFGARGKDIGPNHGYGLTSQSLAINLTRTSLLVICNLLGNQ